jgi:uncharacterized protein
MDSGRDKLGESTTRKGDEGNGSDDDDDDAESLSVTGSGIPDPPQSGKRSAPEDESGHPDEYAMLRREKRLAMNRESARNRRKQKQNLIKSLERQVVDLRALNQQYQISIKELSSKNQKLENELAMSRISMAHLSKGSTAPSAPQQQQQQQHPPHHQQFNPHQLQQLQSQHVPTPREQQPWLFQQQQQQQPQHQLQTQQPQHQSQTQQQPQLQLDLAFLNQGPFSIPITSNESIANTSVAGYAENIFPTSLERVVGWGDDVNFSTNQPITSDRFKSVAAIPAANISGDSAIADTGDATSRLCEPHRDHLPMQLGAAAVNASMLTSTPMLTPTWDSSWRSLQPNAMQSIETDTSLRENLATSATTSQPEHSNVSCAHPVKKIDCSIVPELTIYSLHLSQPHRI